MFVFDSVFGMHLHRHAQTETHLYNGDVLMPKSFIQEFLDVLALGFGTTCTNCLQVEAIVTINVRVGTIIQGICHVCGFILVE